MVKLIMPNRHGGGGTEELLDMRSIVIVGPNGAGKSRLGYWIEQNQGPTRVHRIAAQRSLVFREYIQQQPLEKAERILYFGDESLRQSNRVSRWGGDPNLVHSHLLNDFDPLLALLFAAENKRNRDYATASRVSKSYSDLQDSKLDVLQEIWKSILPHRDLLIGDDKIEAKMPSGIAYSGNAMSDGERVALYLIGQSLCAPPDSIMVIDEPEIHLHRAIQSQLWDEVEASRPDCIFVFITHDLEFAASRSTACKILVNEYDGNAWKWDIAPAVDAIPEQVRWTPKSRPRV